MIARLHYDRHQLQEFLDGGSETQGAELANHVEQCPLCQDQLESIAAADFDWDEASDLLRSENHADTQAADLGDSLSAWHGRLLEPSDHAGALGRFGRYEVMQCLGRGGMGIVFRVLDPELNRFSAVKVLAPELAGSAAARKRFSREARSAAAVVHPHVVPIQTVDEHNGLPYLVMPVVEGQSLQRRVETTGPLSTIEVVRIAAQVAEGLAAAHSQGLVHRDVKAANILLENGVERVQLTDFGLARAIDDASMTRSGVIAGTPQYMSPEQAHGDSMDHRSDLFSLGSVMYFMLTGRSPFRAETTMGVLNRIINENPRDIREINSDVPLWLQQIIMRLLEKSADDRYQSATEVAELLEACLAHLQQPTEVPLPESVELTTAPQPPRRWNRKLLTMLGGFSFLLASIVIILETGKGTIQIESEADKVPIVIKKGGKVYDQLMVNRNGKSIRVHAGEYEVLIDGDLDLFTIDNGAVHLRRGKETVVQIRESSPVPGDDGGMLEVSPTPAGLAGPSSGAEPVEKSWDAIAGSIQESAPPRLDHDPGQWVGRRGDRREDHGAEGLNDATEGTAFDEMDMATSDHSGHYDSIFNENLKRFQFQLERVNVHAVDTPEEFRARLRDDGGLEPIGVWGDPVSDTLTIIAEADAEDTIRRVLAKMEAMAAMTPTLEADREHLLDKRRRLVRDITEMELMLVELNGIKNSDQAKASKQARSIQERLIPMREELETIEQKLETLERSIRNQQRAESKEEPAALAPFVTAGPDEASNSGELLFKSNVQNLRRGDQSHPKLDAIVQVSLTGEHGIDWLFREKPLTREPLGFPFNVDNYSGASLFRFINTDGKVIDSAIRMVCADAPDEFWRRIQGVEVGVHVSGEDFDHVLLGQPVLKIVYLPFAKGDSSSAHVETLDSSELDPGIDALAEARRRGHPIVSMHLKPTALAIGW